MMDAASDLDTTLNLILLNVQQHSTCQVCAIYLTNPNEPVLELRAASGPRNRLALAPSLLISEAAWAIGRCATLPIRMRMISRCICRMSGPIPRIPATVR